MNKKAFTLVELMGVITVLALISLLVAPTIINQIRNSRDKIDSVTENLIYAATDLYLDNKENEYPKYDGSTYCLTLGDLVEDGKLSSPVLDSNGDEISLDKIIAVDVTNNSYNYRMPNNCENKKLKTLSELATISADLGVNSIENCVAKGQRCEIDEDGTAFAIKVNDTEIYKFYVLEDDGASVTLIMDRNLGNDDVTWVSKEDYIAAGGTTTDYGTYGNWNKGPITALSTLKQRTDGWSNILDMEIKTYDDIDGNTHNLVSPFTMKARMVTYTEVKQIQKNNSGVTPTWLYTNLDNDDTTELPYGYLTSSYNTFDTYIVLYVYYKGNTAGQNIADNYAVKVGVRPVIELSK